jgi:hypothetical protein
MLAEAPAAPERAVPQEAQPAQASEPAPNSDEATEPAAAQPAAPLHTLKPELVAAPSSPAQEAVVKVVFRKEGGQTEPDGTYRQEYAAAEGEDIRVASAQIYDPASTTDSDLLAVPGIVPVEATGAGNVPEVAYEDGTLYESAPIPTATRDADPADAGSSRFKTKGKHDNSTVGKPAAAKPAGPAPLRVEGIFWDRTRPMALINGDIVELGSRVRDGKVVDIQPSSVTIEIKGKQTVLTP